jgi:Tfp pilus assembly PilM family ATPase
MQLPLNDPDTAGDIVASAVAGQLRCDPAALMVRHVVVEGSQSATPGKHEVIAMAASRGLINKLMSALKAAKIEPHAIVPEPLALVRSFDHITRRNGDAELTSLYLDLGAGTTKVMVAQGTALVFAKTIQLGGRALDQSVAKQKNCSVSEARSVRLGITTFGRNGAIPSVQHVRSETRDAADAELAQIAVRTSLSALASEDDRRSGKSPPGTLGNIRPTDPAPTADLSDAVDSLTDEIAMCLRYYEAMFPQRQVGRTIFVGGEARHAGLCQHVARKLRLPAHVADPMLRIKRPPVGENVTNGVDFSQPQPGWAVALGLALSSGE